MLSSIYYFSSRWLFSTNHKDIGILYLIFENIKDTKVVLLAPIVKDKKGEHLHLLDEIQKSLSDYL